MKTLKRFSAIFLILSLLSGILFFTMPFPGTIPVLMYHFVGDAQGNSYIEGNFVTEPSFARQMAFLKKFNYRVISLDDYYAIMTGAKKPQGREIVITFDDGDMSFYKAAVPVLARYQFPVAMFLVSDNLKGGKNGSMTEEIVKKLNTDYPWINFQSHTKTHPHLLEIPAEQVKKEFVESRQELSELLGKPVQDLAYPFGQFDAKTVEAAKEAGYRLAFTTGHKRLQGVKEDLHSMTRIKINRISDPAVVFWYQLSGLHQMIKGTREKIKNQTLYRQK